MHIEKELCMKTANQIIMRIILQKKLCKLIKKLSEKYKNTKFWLKFYEQKIIQVHKLHT
jgi:hypothetical protein